MPDLDGIDETDRAILELLLEDARRPYSEIAERVDLSGPAVSDRVERLRERGLIRRFTVDVNRSMLRDGSPLLIDVDAKPGKGPIVQEGLQGIEAVEHSFRTVDDGVVAIATTSERETTSLLESAGILDDVDTYQVRVLADRSWSPGIGSAELSPECAECGNTVDEEGRTRIIDGTQYYFCCPSCEANFVGQYEQFREGA